MSQYEGFIAIIAKLGWTYDNMDEVFRDRGGGMIDPENVLAALPPATTGDELAGGPNRCGLPLAEDDR